MRRLTRSGRSTWRKWPASSTTSTSEPSAMKSSGDPMDDSSMHWSSRPWRYSVGFGVGSSAAACSSASSGTCSVGSHMAR